MRMYTILLYICCNIHINNIWNLHNFQLMQLIHVQDENSKNILRMSLDGIQLVSGFASI